MLNYIQSILLIFLVLIQIVLMLYLLFVTHMRYKEDKKFWKKQDEISEEFLKQLQEQPVTYLDDMTKGDFTIETKTTDKE